MCMCECVYMNVHYPSNEESCVSDAVLRMLCFRCCVSCAVFQISGFIDPDIRISRYPDIRISGNPEIWISGKPAIRKCGSPGFSISRDSVLVQHFFKQAQAHSI